MRQLFTAIILICVIASCQKEVSFDNGNNSSGNTGGNGNANGLLVKTISVTGNETQTTTYTYDTAKRLETLTIVGTSGGISVNSYQKFVRDGAGRIVKVLQKVPDMQGMQVDTATQTYFYPNATTTDFTHSIHVTSMDMGGGVIMATIDSAIYTYNGGKMTSYRSYMSSSLMPGAIMMNQRYDFVYDASNHVTNMKSYSDNGNTGGPLELDVEWNYTYGTPVNNVYMAPSSSQNFALNGIPNAGNRMITKMTMRSLVTTPPMNLTITNNYVLGAGNRPISGTSTTAGVGPQSTTTYTFFYQ